MITTLTNKACVNSDLCGDQRGWSWYRIWYSNTTFRLKLLQF